MESKRIMLRKWNLDDASILVDNLNDEKISSLLGTKIPYSYKDAYTYIEDAIINKKEKYAIVCKNSMKVIGGCGMHLSGDKGSENMWISESYQNQGYGTETSLLLMKHIFEKYPIIKIENVFFEGNMASQKMLLKLGFEIMDVNEEIFVNGKKYIKKIATLNLEEYNNKWCYMNEKMNIE